jgi:hypothetical protein
LYRVLPFWLAGLAERLLILLIPLFAVVFPIVQFVPRIYSSVIQGRIFGLYGELNLLETELEALAPDAPTRDLALQLDQLARRASRLRVPLGYAQRLFIVKSHITLAQQELEKRQAARTK